ncbi:MAG TPA: hypothetical protein VGN55_02895 [Xanthobacteraceae bacterium]
MFSKAGIALSAAIVLGDAPCGAAALMQVATNHASQYGSPDSTPNGPFLNVDTYGVPAAGRQGHQPQRLLRRHR